MLKACKSSLLMLIPGFGQQQYFFNIFDMIEKDPSKCCNRLALCLHELVQALSTYYGSYREEHTQAVMMKNFIEQNLTRPVRIKEVAACVHLSPSRAIHIFTEAFGISPYQHYLAQRFELAQSLLLYTALSIQEISERLGFADHHHFTIFFKKECGMSPSQFRKTERLP